MPIGRPEDARPVPLDDRILAIQQTGLFVDVLRFGLNARFRSKTNTKDIIRQILNVRKTFRQDFADDLAEFIEFYDPNNYLYHSSVAENIIFGDPAKRRLLIDGKSDRQPKSFIEFLSEAKLREPLLNSGVAFIEELIKLFRSIGLPMKKYWTGPHRSSRKSTITKGCCTRLNG